MAQKEKGQKLMKKRNNSLGMKFLIGILFVSGVVLVSYSTICNIYNNLVNSRAQTRYAKTVERNSEEKNNKIWNSAVSYNHEHTNNVIVDAFEGKHNQANTANYAYDEVLNPDGTGMMGYIEIPSINVRLSVYHGISEKTLEQGVGHLTGTSLPVGGKGTHCVLAAHRGLPSARLFTDLDELKKGYHFYLHVLDRTLAYKVDSVEVVLPEKMNDRLAIVSDVDIVTLVTCTPYGVNTHRLLVRGHRVPMDNHKEINPLIKYIKYGSLLGLIAAMWVVLYVHKRKNKQNNSNFRHNSVADRRSVAEHSNICDGKAE